MNRITLIYKGRQYEVPNAWERLTTDDYLCLVGLLEQLQAGQLSVGEVRMHLLCHMMHWKLYRFRTEEQIANLLMLSEQITFPFRIVYPDNNAALKGLTDEDYRLARRTDPYHLRHLPAMAHLCRQDYHYETDLCFFAQLIPTLKVKADNNQETELQGYRATTADGSLSCSLTALQYIEAKKASAQSPALAAAILYTPQPYDSATAQQLVTLMAQLPPLTLKAIIMNFEALNAFLFTKTPLQLLSQFEQGRARSITTDMADALYDLCADGVGNSSEVEQLNVITYLRLLRKKTIDGVRQMHGAGMDLAKIANETGLPVETVAKMI